MSSLPLPRCRCSRFGSPCWRVLKLPKSGGGQWRELRSNHLARRLGNYPGANRLEHGYRDTSGTSLPTALDGVSVSIDGLPAFCYYVSPSQINVIVPEDPANGGVNVQVTSQGVTSNIVTADKEDFGPSLFLFTSRYPAAAHNNAIVSGAAQSSFRLGHGTGEARGSDSFVRHRVWSVGSAAASRTVSYQRGAIGAIGDRDGGRRAGQRARLSGLSWHVPVQSNGSATARPAMRRWSCRSPAAARRAASCYRLGPEEARPPYRLLLDWIWTKGSSGAVLAMVCGSRQ